MNVVTDGLPHQQRLSVHRCGAEGFRRVTYSRTDGCWHLRWRSSPRRNNPLLLSNSEFPRQRHIDESRHAARLIRTKQPCRWHAGDLGVVETRSPPFPMRSGARRSMSSIARAARSLPCDPLKRSMKWDERWPWASPRYLRGDPAVSKVSTWAR